jgi:hypothetical protein
MSILFAKILDNFDTINIHLLHVYYTSKRAYINMSELAVTIYESLAVIFVAEPKPPLLTACYS